MSLSYRSLANFIGDDKLGGLREYLENRNANVDDRDEVSHNAIHDPIMNNTSHNNDNLAFYLIIVVVVVVAEWSDGVDSGLVQRQNRLRQRTADSRSRLEFGGQCDYDYWRLETICHCCVCVCAHCKFITVH